MATVTEHGASPDDAVAAPNEDDDGGDHDDDGGGNHHTSVSAPGQTEPGGPRETFLPAAPALAPRRRKAHLIILGLLMVLCFGRGVYWSLTVVVWSPIDEIQHFGYVESLATGDGIPTVGQDLISDDAMATLKDSPTFYFRSEPYQPNNTDANWGGTRHQYEAIHGPTYYALMVPAYWAGKPFGELGALYAIRIASAALLALIVPLTWLLGRRLFPDRPGVALGAAALIAALNSLAPGQVANDGLAMILAAATTLAFIKACNRAGGWRWPLVAGALFGLTMVTKSTSLVVIPFVGVMVAAWWWVTRPPLARVARLVAGAGIGAVAAFAPWLAWNLHAYGSPTASAAAGAITSHYLPQQSLGLSGIWNHALVAHGGVWLSQLTQSELYPRIWELAFVIALIAGAAAIAVKRRWRDLAVFLWCASAVPAAFLAMEALVFTLFGGAGGPMGRHLIAALPATTIMLAAAVSFVVGTRFLPVVLAWFIAAMLLMDAQLAHTFVSGIYQPLALFGTHAPVVYQGWADGTEPDRDAVVLDGGCAAEWFGIGFFTSAGAAAPPHVRVTTADGATLDATYLLDFGFMPLYALPRPVDGPFTIAVPDGVVMRSSATDRSPQVSYRSGGSDPVASVYCRTADPEETSFQVMYPIGHPDVGSGLLLAAPLVLAGGAGLVALGLTARAVAGAAADRRPVAP